MLVDASVDVHNMGAMDSNEVVQLYVTTPKALNVIAKPKNVFR